MKICLFGDARSPHLKQLSGQLDARGCAVHVVTHKVDRVPGATVEIFQVPPTKLTNPFRWHVRRRRYLHQFLRKFDIVNIHFLYDWGFDAELVQQGCVVVTPWGSDVVLPPEEEHPDEQALAMRRMLLREAAAVSVCSESFAGEVQRFSHVDRSRIHRTPFGVDLDLFRCRPREPGGDVRRIGFYKGFRAVYGPTYLIRALPQIMAKLPTARFTLVGDGPQRAICQSLASELQADHTVTWVAYLPHEQIPSTLANWDVSIIPSVRESFGVAALESAAMGVPVVASAVDGLRETVIDGETGVLIPPESPSVLADAVCELLDDTPRRRRYAEAGRRFVAANFSWEYCTDRWLEAYHAALDRVGVMV